MLNDHAKDLINRAIDGELSDAERDECLALLDDSEAAREYRDEFSRLNDILAQVPSLEPPEELRRRIIGQIQLPRPRKWFTLMAGWMQGRPVSYGIAAGAGLLVAVAVYELAPAPRDASEYSSLVGTLARGSDLEGVVPLGSLDIEHDSVRGRVVLSGNDAMQLLRFDVNSESPVEIAVDLAGAGLAFDGFAQEDEGDLGQVALSERQLRVSNLGARRFTVILHETSGAAKAESGIAVSVSREGEILFQDVLTRQ